MLSAAREGRMVAEVTFLRRGYALVFQLVLTHDNLPRPAQLIAFHPT